ncbi:MAG: RNA 2',3'-cyclic phosphodiesterase [Desulfurococcales archaeon]|nr:RNA 2',3'-cyclic phosphodiesterase [Desulfurococcales archaeon]
MPVRGEVLRVFIAIDVEDPLLLSRLERVKEAVIATGAPMKPVETQNLHITLRFIGEVPRSTVEEIAGLLKTLSFKPFRIKLQGLGAFPSPTRPRVVWVGVSEGAEELERLHGEIEKGLSGLGIRPDRQRFHPHLTLARIKGSRNIHRLARLIAELQDVEIGEMLVDRIRLKRSILTRQGPIYETLEEVRAV